MPDDVAMTSSARGILFRSLWSPSGAVIFAASASLRAFGFWLLKASKISGDEGTKTGVQTCMNFCRGLCELAFE
jgi:hypothetical protein